MIYRKIGFSCLCYLYSIVSWTQTIRHPVKIETGFCSSYTSDYKRQDIIDKSLLGSAPFNSILHLCFKRKDDIKHYGTASFISKNLIVTARHILDIEENLEYIELNIPSSNNQWVRLDRKDYKIYYYTQHFDNRESDIALLKIINNQKLKLLYHGHFKLIDSTDSITASEVNLTGFPFTKFAIKSITPDTLMNRSISFDYLQFNTSKRLIGLPIRVCSGDSGGPLWIKSGSNYFILGVCGSATAKEMGFKNPDLNIFTSINNEILKWIQATIN